jgi:protein TonB
MSLRIPIALGLACIVTFGLFWAMQALIGVSGELKEGRPPPTVEFVRLRRDSAPELKKREPPKREKPDAPPPPPDISMSKASLDPGQGVEAIVPSVDPGDALSGGIGAGGGSDRDAVPLVRIDPEYPMNARQRGIEGWVVVQFSVGPAGTVKDPIVIASHPSNVFDRSALQAVRKWKYNPKIVNGTAVERVGLKVRLDFEMEH